MNTELYKRVKAQVRLVGGSAGGQLLLLRELLDYKRDIFSFMQLFGDQSIDSFFDNHFEELEAFYEEEPELISRQCLVTNTTKAVTKVGLEKTLILIEGEIKRAIS